MPFLERYVGSFLQPRRVIVMGFLLLLFISFLRPNTGDENYHTHLSEYLFEHHEYPYLPGSSEYAFNASIQTIDGVSYQQVFYPPTYHLALGVFMQLHIQDILSPLMVLAILYFAYLLFKRAGIPERETALVLIFILLVGLFFRLSHRFYMEPMAGAAIMIFIYLLYRTMEVPAIRNAVALGLAGMLSLTVKQTSLVIFPIALFTVLLHRDNLRKYFPYVVLGLAISSIGIASWLIHYNITHNVFWVLGGSMEKTNACIPGSLMWDVLSISSPIDVSSRLISTHGYPLSLLIPVNSAILLGFYILGIRGAFPKRTLARNQRIFWSIEKAVYITFLLTFIYLCFLRCQPNSIYLFFAFPFFGFFGLNGARTVARGLSRLLPISYNKCRLLVALYLILQLILIIAEAFIYRFFWSASL